MSYGAFKKWALFLLLAFGLMACKELSSSEEDDEDADEPTYSVIYDGNTSTSGAVPVDSLRYAAGKTVTVKSNSGNLAKTGFTFGGWNTLADGNGTDRLPGATFAMGSANVTLWAKWIESLTALWACSVSSGDATSRFHAVTTDSSGNVYAVGIQEGTTTYTYGPGVTATAGNSPYNAVIVKYGPAGTALWAKVAVTAPSYGGFSGVATDSSGNVYAVGYQNGTSAFDYGSGKTAQGTCSFGSVVIVKYDADGNALWAKSTSGGPNSCGFSAVATDSSGNVYAAGVQEGSGLTYDYGNGKTATGTWMASNALIVKYDTDGTTQWAKTVTTGPANSYFSGVAANASGYVYAVGTQETGTFNYGGADVTGGASGNNAVIVKYDATTGTAIWNTSSDAGSIDSSFSGVAVDFSGNVYAAGMQANAANSYGGASVTGEGPLLVKFGSGGAGTWAKSITGGGETGFSGVAVDSSGNVYCAGEQAGTSTVDYGGASASGSYSGSNVVIVKYDSAGTAVRARSVSEGANFSRFTGVSVVPGGDVFAAGVQAGNSPYTYGTGVSATGYNTNEHSVVVKYLR